MPSLGKCPWPWGGGLRDQRGCCVPSWLLPGEASRGSAWPGMDLSYLSPPEWPQELYTTVPLSQQLLGVTAGLCATAPCVRLGRCFHPNVKVLEWKSWTRSHVSYDFFSLNTQSLGSGFSAPAETAQWLLETRSKDWGASRFLSAMSKREYTHALFSTALCHSVTALPRSGALYHLLAQLQTNSSRADPHFLSSSVTRRAVAACWWNHTQAHARKSTESRVNLRRH